MKQPAKWRETIDPFTINFKHFKLIEVLGYPHAGNDVFHVRGEYQGESCSAYIKVERQTGANILNEVAVIGQLHFPFIPQVLEYSKTSPRYIITREMPGERLSTLLGANEGYKSLDYMETYGNTLALLHQAEVDCADVVPRRFSERPAHERVARFNLEFAEEFLINHPPTDQTKCFVHGDFHYANLLWLGGQISGVLDFELSGLGIREYDMAWAVLLREGQKFLKTTEERELFLKGYAKKHPFSRIAFDHYLVQIACHFFSFGDEDYQADLMKIIHDVILTYH